MLIHSGQPWLAEGAYVAQILPRVYLELSITMPWSSLALDNLLELLLGVAPTNKVLYGSDESTDPEVLWLSAQVGREALERVLTKARDHGWVDDAEAMRIGSGVLGGNVLKLHGVRVMETPAEVQERLRGEDVSLVALHFSDMAGMSRVKVIPLRRLEAVARSGSGWSDIWAVVCIDEHYADVAPYNSPSGDARLIPDLSQVRALPSLPGYAWVPIDQFTQELEPLPVCPRHVLRLAQDRLAKAGVSVQSTYEVEMTLLRDGQPATAGPGYSVRAFVAIRDFMRDIAEALESAGVPIEQMHPEYAPGQFEVSIAPSTPLEAADRLLLFRFIARTVAADHGMDASFAPVVFPGGLGNGSHMHLSLWRDDQNRMTGGDAPGGMQADGAAFLAGIRDELRR